MLFKPEIDVEKCIGCGECVNICPVAVLELINGKSTLINAEDCLGCESCTDVCQQEAIMIMEVLKRSGI